MIFILTSISVYSFSWLQSNHYECDGNYDCCTNYESWEENTYNTERDNYFVDEDEEDYFVYGDNTQVHFDRDSLIYSTPPPNERYQCKVMGDEGEEFEDSPQGKEYEIKNFRPYNLTYDSDPYQDKIDCETCIEDSKEDRDDCITNICFNEKETCIDNCIVDFVEKDDYESSCDHLYDYDLLNDWDGNVDQTIDDWENDCLDEYQSCNNSCFDRFEDNLTSHDNITNDMIPNNWDGNISEIEDACETEDNCNVSEIDSFLIDEENKYNSCKSGCESDYSTENCVDEGCFSSFESCKSNCESEYGEDCYDNYEINGCSIFSEYEDDCDDCESNLDDDIEECYEMTYYEDSCDVGCSYFVYDDQGNYQNEIYYGTCEYSDDLEEYFIPSGEVTVYEIDECYLEIYDQISCYEEGYAYCDENYECNLELDEEEVCGDGDYFVLEHSNDRDDYNLETPSRVGEYTDVLHDELIDFFPYIAIGEIQCNVYYDDEDDDFDVDENYPCDFEDDNEILYNAEGGERIFPGIYPEHIWEQECREVEHPGCEEENYVRNQNGECVPYDDLIDDECIGCSPHYDLLYGDRSYATTSVYNDCGICPAVNSSVFEVDENYLAVPFGGTTSSATAVYRAYSGGVGRGDWDDYDDTGVIGNLPAFRHVGREEQTGLELLSAETAEGGIFTTIARMVSTLFNFVIIRGGRTFTPFDGLFQDTSEFNYNPFEHMNYDEIMEFGSVADFIDEYRHALSVLIEPTISFLEGDYDEYDDYFNEFEENNISEHLIESFDNGKYELSNMVISMITEYMAPNYLHMANRFNQDNFSDINLDHESTVARARQEMYYQNDLIESDAYFLFEFRSIFSNYITEEEEYFPFDFPDDIQFTFEVEFDSSDQMPNGIELEYEVFHTPSVNLDSNLDRGLEYLKISDELANEPGLLGVSPERSEIVEEMLIEGGPIIEGSVSRNYRTSDEIEITIDSEDFIEHLYEGKGDYFVRLSARSARGHSRESDWLQLPRDAENALSISVGPDTPHVPLSYEIVNQTGILCYDNHDWTGNGVDFEDDSCYNWVRDEKDFADSLFRNFCEEENWLPKNCKRACEKAGGGMYDYKLYNVSEVNDDLFNELENEHIFNESFAVCCGMSGLNDVGKTVHAVDENNNVIPNEFLCNVECDDEKDFEEIFDFSRYPFYFSHDDDVQYSEYVGEDSVDCEYEFKSASDGKFEYIYTQYVEGVIEIGNDRTPDYKHEEDFAFGALGLGGSHYDPEEDLSGNMYFTCMPEYLKDDFELDFGNLPLEYVEDTPFHRYDYYGGEGEYDWSSGNILSLLDSPSYLYYPGSSDNFGHSIIDEPSFNFDDTSVLGSVVSSDYFSEKTNLCDPFGTGYPIFDEDNINYECNMYTDGEYDYHVYNENVYPGSYPICSNIDDREIDSSFLNFYIFDDFDYNPFFSSDSWTDKTSGFSYEEECIIDTSEDYYFDSHGSYDRLRFNERFKCYYDDSNYHNYQGTFFAECVSDFQSSVVDSDIFHKFTHGDSITRWFPIYDEDFNDGFLLDSNEPSESIELDLDRHHGDFNNFLTNNRFESLSSFEQYPEFRDYYDSLEEYEFIRIYYSDVSFGSSNLKLEIKYGDKSYQTYNLSDVTYGLPFSSRWKVAEIYLDDPGVFNGIRIYDDDHSLNREDDYFVSKDGDEKSYILAFGGVEFVRRDGREKYCGLEFVDSDTGQTYSDINFYEKEDVRIYDTWVDDLNDNKFACEGNPNTYWTGTRCCGVEGSETYVDDEAACLHGIPFYEGDFGTILDFKYSPSNSNNEYRSTVPYIFPEHSRMNQFLERPVVSLCEYSFSSDDSSQTPRNCINSFDVDDGTLDYAGDFSEDDYIIYGVDPNNGIKENIYGGFEFDSSSTFIEPFNQSVNNTIARSYVSYYNEEFRLCEAPQRIRDLFNHLGVDYTSYSIDTDTDYDYPGNDAKTIGSISCTPLGWTKGGLYSGTSNVGKLPPDVDKKEHIASSDQRNYLVHLPQTVLSNDYLKEEVVDQGYPEDWLSDFRWGACPEGWCWNGTSCVNNQDYAIWEEPEFDSYGRYFNSSNETLDSGYKCSNGRWVEVSRTRSLFSDDYHDVDYAWPTDQSQFYDEENFEGIFPCAVYGGNDRYPYEGIDGDSEDFYFCPYGSYNASFHIFNDTLSSRLNYFNETTYSPDLVESPDFSGTDYAPSLYKSGRFLGRYYCDEGTWKSRVGIMADRFVNNFDFDSETNLFCGSPNDLLKYKGDITHQIGNYTSVKSHIDGFCSYQSNEMTVLGLAFEHYSLTDDTIESYKDAIEYIFEKGYHSLGIDIDIDEFDFSKVNDYDQLYDGEPLYEVRIGEDSNGNDIHVRIDFDIGLIYLSYFDLTNSTYMFLDDSIDNFIQRTLDEENIDLTQFSRIYALPNSITGLSDLSFVNENPIFSYFVSIEDDFIGDDKFDENLGDYFNLPSFVDDSYVDDNEYLIFERRFDDRINFTHNVDDSYLTYYNMTKRLPNYFTFRE